MTVVIEPDDRKTYLEKRILYHLTAYKKLPPSFIRAGIRVMLIKMMNEYNKLAKRVAYHCTSWW
jgi:hypothetical protein